MLEPDMQQGITNPRQKAEDSNQQQNIYMKSSILNDDDGTGHETTDQQSMTTS